MLKPRHAGELHNPSELIASLLRDGIAVAFEADGTSMLPTIRPGDRLRVVPAARAREGDVVLTSSGRLTAHRIVRIERHPDGAAIVTRGDNSDSEDVAIPERDLLGVVVSLTRDGGEIPVDRRSRSRTSVSRLARRTRAHLSTLLRRRR